MFLIITDSQDVAKEMYSEALCSLHSRFLNGNILYNYYTLSNPGKKHWYTLGKLFKFHQIYMYLFVHHVWV